MNTCGGQTLAGGSHGFRRFGTGLIATRDLFGDESCGPSRTARHFLAWFPRISSVAIITSSLRDGHCMEQMLAGGSHERTAFHSPVLKRKGQETPDTKVMLTIVRVLRLFECGQL